jgi:hypothetical protein
MLKYIGTDCCMRINLTVLPFNDFPGRQRGLFLITPRALASYNGDSDFVTLTPVNFPSFSTIKFIITRPSYFHLRTTLNSFEHIW